MTAKVYIAGPMTGYENWNRPAFDAAAEHLRGKGYEVVSPAEMDDGLSEEQLASLPHAFFMRRDLVALLDCDLIYLLPGWKHSKGATLEAAVAKGCGIDELRDADEEIWRTFEGEPLPEVITDHRVCDVEQGDGTGNEWCVHGEQVSYADAPEPEISPRHSGYQPGDEFPNVAYVRDMTGRTDLGDQPCSISPSDDIRGAFFEGIPFMVDPALPENVIRVQTGDGEFFDLLFGVMD